MISKETYVTRNFQKISNKRWELYVITRVIHLLDDPDIEYICQQYINPPDNKNYYLADLAFPSLELYLEVDEMQHDNEIHKLSDITREKEILEATNWECKRIPVYVEKDSIKVDKKLKLLNRDIENFVEFIKRRKQIFLKKGYDINWNFEKKYNPETYINKKILKVSDNVTLLTHRDVLNLFGYNKGHYQRAYWRIKGFNEAVWFPKLYDNKEWVNSFDNSTGTICQYRKDGEPWELPSNEDRVLFAHNKNILGQTVYKFYGIFSVDKNKTNTIEHYFNRVSDTIDLGKYLKNK